MIDSQFTPEAAGAIPGPDWLARRRVAAAEQVAAAAMPSVEEELWRYTPIGQLDLGRYQLATDAGNQSPTAIPGHCAIADTSNGRLCGVELSPEAADQGVEVRPLGDSDADLAASVDVDLFALMNAAFSVEPLLVRVPPGVSVEGPIVVRHWLDADGGAVFPRLIVDAGADSSVEVLELYGSADVAAFVSPVVEIRVASAARVGYLAMQDLGPKVWHIGSQVSHMPPHCEAPLPALAGSMPDRLAPSVRAGAPLATSFRCTSATATRLWTFAPFKITPLPTPPAACCSRGRWTTPPVRSTPG